MLIIIIIISIIIIIIIIIIVIINNFINVPNYSSLQKGKLIGDTYTDRN